MASSETTSSEAASHGDPYGPGAAAGVVLSVVAGELHKDERNGNDQKKDKPCGKAVVVVVVLAELARAEIHDHVDGVIDAGVVVVVLKGWNHLLLNDVLGGGVGKIRFHAIAWADVHPASLAAFLGFDENDHPIVFPFLPHAPAVADLRGKLFHIIALQVIDEQDQDLGGGAVVVCHQLVLQRVDLRSAQGTCVVVYQPGRVGWTWQLGFHRCVQEQQQEHEAEKDDMSLTVSCFHRKCHREFH